MPACCETSKTAVVTHQYNTVKEKTFSFHVYRQYMATLTQVKTKAGPQDCVTVPWVASCPHYKALICGRSIPTYPGSTGYCTGSLWNLTRSQPEVIIGRESQDSFTALIVLKNQTCLVHDYWKNNKTLQLKPSLLHLGFTFFLPHFSR